MAIIIILIPLSILLVLIAVFALHWSITKGHYDNMEKDAEKILFDDDRD